jgi:DNA polymerase alpha subunit A
VLKQVLSGEATENVIEHVHDYLEALGKRVRASEVDLDDFIILKVRLNNYNTLASFS